MTTSKALSALWAMNDRKMLRGPYSRRRRATRTTLKIRKSLNPAGRLPRRSSQPLWSMKYTRGGCDRRRRFMKSTRKIRVIGTSMMWAMSWTCGSMCGQTEMRRLTSETSRQDPDEDLVAGRLEFFGPFSLARRLRHGGAPSGPAAGPECLLRTQRSATSPPRSHRFTGSAEPRTSLSRAHQSPARELDTPMSDSAGSSATNAATTLYAPAGEPLAPR